MARMKTDVMGLLHNAALALKHRGDSGTAFALLEMGNNLRLVMREEASLDEWNECYAGADAEPFDIDAILPVPAE